MLDVKTDIAKALRLFYDLPNKQLPFTFAMALNNTINAVKHDLRQEMVSKFVAPKTFTLNSLRVIPAKKDNLTAAVTFKDGAAGGGRSAGKYLAPEIYGGSRSVKAFERALSLSGLVPTGYLVVPAKGFPLDANGNIPRAFIARVLAYLRAVKGNGKRGKLEFFVIAQDNPRGLPKGIYQRKVGSARMVMAFVLHARYKQRFKFFEVAQATTKRTIEVAAKAAYERVMRSK